MNVDYRLELKVIVAIRFERRMAAGKVRAVRDGNRWRWWIIRGLFDDIRGDVYKTREAALVHGSIAAWRLALQETL